MIEIDKLALTGSQRGLLRNIHILAERMEEEYNQGRVHALIALLEELSEGVVSPAYVREKLELLTGLRWRYE